MAVRAPGRATNRFIVFFALCVIMQCMGRTGFGRVYSCHWLTVHSWEINFENEDAAIADTHRLFLAASSFATSASFSSRRARRWWTGRRVQNPFRRRQRRFCSFPMTITQNTTPAQVVEGGVMVGRDIIEVWEDDHLSGRRCQACGLTQKSVEEIAVHQRVGGKVLACSLKPILMWALVSPQTSTPFIVSTPFLKTITMFPNATNLFYQIPL